MSCKALLIPAAVLMLAALPARPAAAQRPLVPGTGTLIDYVGDDFEDPNWQFVQRRPKSSREQDEQLRAPTGYSVNGRWFEGPERGHPDHLKVVPTPPDGLPGSEYSLLMMTLNSGIPGQNTRKVEQDDLIVECMGRLGGAIPVAEMPSVVVRIYLPHPEEWENRSGPQFGFRVGASTTVRESGFLGLGSSTKSEPYWPGMWIHFRSAGSRDVETDSAFIKVRGDRRGRDFHVLEIEEFGWWTLGMSLTGDGMVHYYAHPGVEPLTEADYITSQYPYGFKAEIFRTFFFDVCNWNDGRTWSTPFIIDDPQLYVVNSRRVLSIIERKEERARQRASSQQRSRNTQRRR